MAGRLSEKVTVSKVNDTVYITREKTGGEKKIIKASENLLREAVSKLEEIKKLKLGQFLDITTQWKVQLTTYYDVQYINFCTYDMNGQMIR